MASIYKLVAERRDRNQSMKRKRNSRNINLFKDSIEEQVQYRRPALYRNYTYRQRAVSDQPPGRETQPPLPLVSSIRRPASNDIAMVNVKNQIKDVDTKVESLNKKIDELTKCIASLRNELNKK